MMSLNVSIKTIQILNKNKYKKASITKDIIADLTQEKEKEEEVIYLYPVSLADHSQDILLDSFLSEVQRNISWILIFYFDPPRPVTQCEKKTVCDLINKFIFFTRT